MALFTRRAPQVNYNNSAESIKKLCDHINYLQETLERYAAQTDKKIKALEGDNNA